MQLYVFLSVIVICITIIICFLIANFIEISDYHRYKPAYYEFQNLKDAYNENIIKHQTQIENICSNIAQLKIFDDVYYKTNKEFISLFFSIKQILTTDIKNDYKLKDINNIIDNFKL